LTTIAVSGLALSGLTLSGVVPSGTARAQGQATQPGAAKPSAVTVGFMHAIHATNEVEKTLAFYRDVFGVNGQVRDFANPNVPILTNSPGVTLRVSMLNLPGQGFNFELTQFGNTERRPAQPQMFDPGAPHMKFLVRDISTVFANIKKLGAPIITTSGAPVQVSTPLGTVKAIFFRDPDGYIVEAIETAAEADAPAGNVVGSIMGLTVRDMNETIRFYKGMLGWELFGDTQFLKDPATLDLMGVPKGGEYRGMSAVVPGSRARMVFVEFKGMPRKEFSLRVPDPGASGMAIRVAAIHELLPKLKAQGIRVISKDGELVNWSATLRNVFVKDPNGLNIELVGEAPKTTP
jgi:catechol 2,3-dioxygenase-like lactoylglutathione lyase family enzyme